MANPADSAFAKIVDAATTTCSFDKSWSWHCLSLQELDHLRWPKSRVIS